MTREVYKENEEKTRGRIFSSLKTWAGGDKILVVKEITLKDLFEAGCHFGHKTSRWHPRMDQYIYSAKDSVHIFDLEKTKKAIEEAAAFVKTMAAEDGEIIFVGTKRSAQKILKEAAEKTNMPYVIERWLGGTLTNWQTIKRNNIDKLIKLKNDKKEGHWDELTKKEKVLLDRQIAKLERLVGGLVNLEGAPKAIFVVDAHKDDLVVREANRKGVKIIAMVDSNTDPDKIDFVIPANDDAHKSIEYVVGLMVEAIEEGKKSKKKEKTKDKKKSEKKGKGVKKAKIS